MIRCMKKSTCMQVKIVTYEQIDPCRGWNLINLNIFDSFLLLLIMQGDLVAFFNINTL